MKSNNSFIKKKKADEKAKKRNEKFQKRLDKNKSPKKDFNDMIAYVDKFGNISSEPPVDTEPDVNNNNN